MEGLWGTWSLFDAITDEKGFDDDRETPVSMGGEGHVEFKYQSGMFVTLCNGKINAMKKDSLYAALLLRDKK